MDYDGANIAISDRCGIDRAGAALSPDGKRVIYVSYKSGFPHIYVMTLSNLQQRQIDDQPGTMTFAPRYAPDGRTAIISLEQGGNTDLYRLDLASGQATRLTNDPSIDTAPSYSPDGIADRVRKRPLGRAADLCHVGRWRGRDADQLWSGADTRTPVWSPRGDMIAFTKQNDGRFYIGVMKTDGSEERLLTASYLDEGPTWAPNGRVIMFTREAAGADGAPQIYSVDISGRNLKQHSDRWCRIGPGLGTFAALTPELRLVSKGGADLLYDGQIEPKAKRTNDMLTLNKSILLVRHAWPCRL